MSEIKILRGHESAETAYLVNDYPYGFRLRCKIRYWLETKKGHGCRLVSQTTNPKREGQPIGCDSNGDFWNKPKGSTYTPGLSFMYLDEQGHVTWTSVSFYYHTGEKFAEFRAKWSPQLNDDERAALDVLEKMSRKLNPNCWADYDKQVEAQINPPPVVYVQCSNPQAANYVSPDEVMKADWKAVQS